MSKLIRIATRGSKLALWQANYVSSMLQGMGYQTHLNVIKTQGDIVQDRFLHEIGGKGLFVKELETSMRNGESDIAVHSLKDLPARLPDDFRLAAVLKRHSPKDVIIFKPESYQRLKMPAFDLTQNELRLLGPLVIATASLRRQSLLKKCSQEFNLQPVRGNVDTRIHKLLNGPWDALILANASLERLNIQGLHTRCLAPDWFIPSPAQGALAIECLATNPFHDVIHQLDHAETHKAVRIERKVLEILGGDCTMPYACHVTAPTPTTVEIRASVLNQEGDSASTSLTYEQSLNTINEDVIIRDVLQNLQSNGLTRILADLKISPPDLGKLSTNE